MKGRRRPQYVEVAALTIVILAGVGLRLLYVHHEVIVFPDEGSYLELAANLLQRSLFRWRDRFRGCGDPSVGVERPRSRLRGRSGR